MANVFISYERSAEETARAVIELLRVKGHDTWSDAQIPPHRDYGDVIAERLQWADAVLVLWSDGAAQSHWVRAEADHALEHHKLVQASLDATPLPLPFNRIQFARLPGWTGDEEHPEWQKVLASIDQVSGSQTDPSTAPVQAVVGPPVRGRSRALAWAIAGAIVIATALLAYWFARPRSPAPVAMVARFAILPFDVLSADPDTRYFADALADQIATTLSRNHIQVVSRDDASALRGADREGAVARLGVAMVLDGTVRKDGDKVTVRTHLDDPVRHAIVWSSELEGTAQNFAQLQTRVATTILGVLGCSNRALRPTNGLTDPALLTRYLSACDLFANSAGGAPKDVLQLISELRAVTVGAPDFAPAFSDLAKFEATFADLWPERKESMFKEAAEAAQHALAIDPKSPDAYAAQAIIVPQSNWAERERLLRAGIAVDPSWPHTHGYLSEMVLANVGRMNDAVNEMRAAAAADLQIDWSQEATFLEARAGHPPGPCIEAFLWKLNTLPFFIGDWAELLACRALAGQWDEGLALLTASNAPTAGTPIGAALIASFTARKTGASADRENARRLNLAAAEAVPSWLQVAIGNLASLGFVDDAFSVAVRFDANVNDTTNLFEPFTASMRRDPRFMQLAARIGLVDYWKTSGHWPDFCSEPGFPYDCRVEADRVKPG